MENHESYLQENVMPIAQYSRSLTIKNGDENLLALAQLERIKHAQKWVKQNIDPVVTQAYAAHTEACRLRNKFIIPLQAAEADIKGAMIRFNRAIEDERRLLQMEAEAKARAEEERQRKELEARAAKAAEAGKVAKAEAILEQAAAVVVVAPVIQPQAEKPRNMSFVKYWVAEVIDASKLDRQWLMPNQSAIDAFVKATKGTVEIPGVKITERERASVRV